jgi:N-formylglutamate amidohydrolase
MITKEKRLLEEDIDTHRIYSSLVLKKSGIWIDSKFSRFACDFNRAPERAIYSNDQERFTRKIWKEELASSERKELLEAYAQFYFTLGHLVEAYRFNIIFDAHSMRDAKGRPEISFGTKYIPTFYMPVVRSIQRKFSRLGYSPVSLNKPYGGGYILKWLNRRFPDVFIFSMEVNKMLYMTKNRRKTVEKRLRRLSDDIFHMFEIEDAIDSPDSA